MFQILLTSGRKAKYYNALNISVCNIIIHSKNLKTSPGTQTVTHAALKFIAYVSNVTEKQQESKILQCTKY